jgi:hypothetical protein
MIIINKSSSNARPGLLRPAQGGRLASSAPRSALSVSRHVWVCSRLRQRDRAGRRDATQAWTQSGGATPPHRDDSPGPTGERRGTSGPVTSDVLQHGMTYGCPMQPALNAKPLKSLLCELESQRETLPRASGIERIAFDALGLVPGRAVLRRMGAA